MQGKSRLKDVHQHVDIVIGEVLIAVKARWAAKKANKVERSISASEGTDVVVKRGDLSSCQTQVVFLNSPQQVYGLTDVEFEVASTPLSARKSK